MWDKGQPLLENEFEVNLSYTETHVSKRKQSRAHCDQAVPSWTTWLGMLEIGSLKTWQGAEVTLAGACQGQPIWHLTHSASSRQGWGWLFTRAARDMDGDF